MAEEARFARAWVDVDLRSLPAHAPILEVGGGIFLLSCQLAREGFSVTAVEPTGVGFGEFEELGNIVLDLAGREGAKPAVARCAIEQFASDARFDLAFSVNVMEHVAAPDGAIARVTEALASGGSYRFLCPNSVFPYEPHFNIPTLFSKQITWRLMRRRILGRTGVVDPAGLWESLNWISVPQVRRIVRADRSLHAHFQTRTLAWMLGRALSESRFAARRSPWMLRAIRTLHSLGLLRLAAIVPAGLQPIMDVRLTRQV